MVWANCPSESSPPGLWRQPLRLYPLYLYPGLVVHLERLNPSVPAGHGDLNAVEAPVVVWVKEGFEKIAERGLLT